MNAQHIFNKYSFAYQGYRSAVICFILDQLSKLAILRFLPLHERLSITPFMDFVHIRNTGISYGLFSNMGEIGRWLLIILSLGLIMICVVWLKRSHSQLHAIALGLIIGGGGGNLLDRLAYGNVIDFISLHAFGYYWYVFNFADIWLSLGIVLFLLADIRRIRHD